jgi:hypothetical protein
MNMRPGNSVPRPQTPYVACGREARIAYGRAAGLTRPPAVRAFLLARADALARLGWRSGQA